MAKYYLELDKKKCIGCGACAALMPDVFEIDPDGKSELIGGKPGKDGRLVIEITKDAAERCIQVASSCPTGAIKVLNAKGEEL